MPKRWLLLLCLAALPLFFSGLCHRGFTDNEGMYAEVAREILRSGDWLTTRINGAPYLNKPPLLFWLSAVVLRVAGLSELPRLISGLAALGTMVLLYALGRRLWPRHATAGAWAAAVFLSSALTPVEARILRPDSLLTFLISLTLWGAARVSTRPKLPDRVGQAAMWGGVGLGVMAKGLVGLLLPAIILFPALFLGRRGRDVPRYCPAWGFLLAGVIILPWHLAVGWVNPGFWWDYVVNQHLLYFFDRKYPHDSVSHPLWFAWAAFAGRLSPWLLLLPAAIMRQVHQARTEQEVTSWLPLTWLGMVWLFFSMSKGRMEHYFLPAVPAAALLVGRLCAEWVSEGQGSETATTRARDLVPGPSALARGARRERVIPFLLLSLLGSVGLVAAPGLLRSSGVLGVAPELMPVAWGAFTVVTVGCLTAAMLAWTRRFSLALGTLVVTFLLFGAFACRGLDAVDPLVSARPSITRLDPRLLSQSTVAYEAGEEYQLCGGLNFYLRRRLLLLEPQGFIPPTYLQRYVGDLFVSRDRFWTEWREGKRRILLFTDPTRPLERPADFPQPCYEVGRGDDSLILTNQPVSAPPRRGVLLGSWGE